MMTFRDIFWHTIPPTRVGVFSGRLQCPCEVQLWDAADALFPDVSGKTVVDLGCGPGIKSLTFAAAGAAVIGFDVRASAVQHARENLRQLRDAHPELPLQAEYHQQDLQAGLAVIPDAAAHIVLLVEVIEHLPEYRTLLQEIHRILTPSGRVLITTPNKVLRRKHADERVYGEQAFGHVHEFDMAELIAIVEQAGLSVTHRSYFNPPAVAACCRLLHPWMIRDHAFLQRKAQIDDVIGIRTLTFLQPAYNALFPLISLLISGYNRVLFPLLCRLVIPQHATTTGNTLFLVAAKP